MNKEENKPGEQQDAAPSDAPKKPTQAEKVAEVKKALGSFPTLKEGYVTAKGVFFDREIAEQSLAEGEELIIVSPPKKK